MIARRRPRPGCGISRLRAGVRFALIEDFEARRMLQELADLEDELVEAGEALQLADADYTHTLARVDVLKSRIARAAPALWAAGGGA
jgi:hypothetical protein